MSERLKNMVENIHPADVAWGALAIGVIAYDVIGEETMSERFREYTDHPLGKYAAVGAVGVMGAHLLGIWEHLDMPDPVLVASDYVGEVIESIQMKLEG